MRPASTTWRSGSAEQRHQHRRRRDLGQSDLLAQPQVRELVLQDGLRADLHRRRHARAGGDVGQVAPEERPDQAQPQRPRRARVQHDRRQQPLVVRPGRRGRHQLEAAAAAPARRSSDTSSTPVAAVPLAAPRCIAARRAPRAAARPRRGRRRLPSRAAGSLEPESPAALRLAEGADDLIRGGLEERPDGRPAPRARGAQGRHACRASTPPIACTGTATRRRGRARSTSRPSARSSLPGVANTGPRRTKSAPSPAARRTASTRMARGADDQRRETRARTSRDGQAFLRQLHAGGARRHAPRRGGRSRARACRCPRPPPRPPRPASQQGPSARSFSRTWMTSTPARAASAARSSRSARGPAAGGRSPGSARNRARARRAQGVRARALRCWCASCTASTMFTRPSPVTVPRVNGLSTSARSDGIGLQEVVRVPERRPGHDDQDDAHQQRAEDGEGHDQQLVHARAPRAGPARTRRTTLDRGPQLADLGRHVAEVGVLAVEVGEQRQRLVDVARPPRGRWPGRSAGPGTPPRVRPGAFSPFSNHFMASLGMPFSRKQMPSMLLHSSSRVSSLAASWNSAMASSIEPHLLVGDARGCSGCRSPPCRAACRRPS